jgi:DNA-binding response OmpR family regulator
MARGTSPKFAQLLAVSDNITPTVFQLSMDDCVIGRSPELCNIVINDKTISRIQAKIENKGSHFILSGLGRNPTFVDKTRLTGPHQLHDGDMIGFSYPNPLIRFVDEDPTYSVLDRKRLVFDEKASMFLFDDREIQLTPSQFRLMLHLYRNLNTVCSRESCARAIWREEYIAVLEIDNLDKVINGVRKQLSAIDPGSDLIKNRRGIGYLLDDC